MEESTQPGARDGADAAPKPAPRAVSFTGADGLTLRGDAWGEAGAPPVLLLHGGGQTRHSWAGTAARLGAEGWRAIALDARGHGESDWAEGGAYGLDHFVGDLRSVAAGFAQPPAVVGASLGGMTALIAAGEATETVASAVVLVDVTPRLEPRGVERIISFMESAPEGFASLEEAADRIAAYRAHRARPSDLSGLAKNLRRGGDGRYRWHWDPAFLDGRRPAARDSRSAILNPHRLIEAAGRLRVPTLLVRGRESDVVSEEGVAEFLRAAPRARFRDVSGAGHMVAGDRNDAFTSAVIEFLSEAWLPDPSPAQP